MPYNCIIPQTDNFSHRIRLVKMISQRFKIINLELKDYETLPICDYAL